VTEIDVSRRRLGLRGLLALAGGAVAGIAGRSASAATQPATDLQERVARLEHSLATAEAKLNAVADSEAITRLQRIYGYYMDKAQWDQIPLLFTQDCEIEINRGGVFVGPKSWEKLRYSSPQGGEKGLRDGMLFNHMILQGVVDVAPGGRTAQGRWRCFLQMARWGVWNVDSEGIYENEYAKVDGRWLIRRMVYAQTFTSDAALGYAHSGGGVPPPARLPGAPDKPSTIPEAKSWPQTWLLPYHFANPGRPRV
jgi:SnoaL-like domain